ncbi:MAG: hypothetical protein GY785_03575, partial [Gammaproteobacteria bacterium]|nr:hypothetical protein [Gammaproteobacteria bacterium]
MRAKSPQYQCRECATALSKWSGQCPDCKSWNSIDEIPTMPSARSNWHGKPQSELLTLDRIPTSATPRFGSH